MWVELALVDVVDFVLFPFHGAGDFSALLKCADKIVTVFNVHLLALAVEEVVFELAGVHEVFGDVGSFDEHVVVEGAFSVRAVFEEENALTVGFAVGKLSDIQRAVVFIETSVAGGIAHLCN